MKKLRTIPRSARMYFLLAAFCIALPSILNLYEGHTGKFLVSTGLTRGSVFEETVIYIRRHNFWGAHGVIINKPVPSKDFRVPFPELAWNIDLYNGGPVAYGDVHFVLVDWYGKDRNDLPELVDTRNLEEQYAEMAAVLAEGANEEPVRLFTGYSGWGMMQLNREIVMGGWGVIDYDPALIYATPVDEIWKRAVEKLLESRPAASGGV